MGRAKPESQVQEAPRGRILDAAVRLFSVKGFEGTKVSEIAAEACANKALIYYYFSSKQAVLDGILDGFFSDVTRIGIDFVQENIGRMIADDRLEIRADRMHFSSAADMQAFKDRMLDYHRKMLRYMMDRRDVLRILLAESLRSGSQRDALFRFFRLFKRDLENPLYLSIGEADPDFAYNEETIFRKFFFGMLPMINFAVFHTDYQKVSGMAESELVEACTAP